MKSGLLFISILLCCLYVIPLYAQDDLYVEGVVFDQDNPKGSLAFINGLALMEGDQIQGYRVESIQDSSVRVTYQKTGKKFVIRVKGRKKKSREPAPKVIQELEEADYKMSKGLWAKLQEKTEDWMNQLNVSQKSNSLIEAQALANLRKVQVAATMYEVERNALPTSLETLMRNGYLPKSFETGKLGDYQYEIESQDQSLDIYADPVDLGAELRYFYIGIDGQIRTEEETRAGPQSKLFNPYEILGPLMKNLPAGAKEDYARAISEKKG